jgi:uncharacterized protein (DUF3820 family)
MSNIKKNKKVNVKTKTGGEYSYTYTDLASINTYLETNKIKYYQYIESTEYGDYIMTVIIENDLEKTPRRGCKVIDASTTSGGNVVQDYGATLTYCRRYSLLLALGLATDDNDANELTNGTYEVKENNKTLTKEEAENFILTFGKYKNKTLKEIIELDKNYIEWLKENGKEPIKKALLILDEDETNIDDTKEEEFMIIQENQKQIIEEAIERKIINLEEVLKYYEVSKIDNLKFDQALEIEKTIKNRITKSSKEKEEVF